MQCNMSAIWCGVFPIAPAESQCAKNLAHVLSAVRAILPRVVKREAQLVTGELAERLGFSLNEKFIYSVDRCGGKKTLQSYEVESRGQDCKRPGVRGQDVQMNFCSTEIVPGSL
jgi:hypothetical protein